MPKHVLYNLIMMAAADVMPFAGRGGYIVSRAAERVGGTLRAIGLAPNTAEMGTPAPARPILESAVLPFYAASSAHHHILFVGCGHDTAADRARFADKIFATIDPEPERAHLGADRHHVAPMRNIAGAHAPGSLDLIMCGHLDGGGIATRADAAAAFTAAYAALRPGGHLIVGWSYAPGEGDDAVFDGDAHASALPDDIAARVGFAAIALPTLGCHAFEIGDDAHDVLLAYAKPNG